LKLDSRLACGWKQIANLRDTLGVAVPPRVTGVERVHVGQDHEQVRGQEDRDLRGEDVVVAEADLVGRGGVVLVDHGHYAPVDQLAQGSPGVQVLHASRDVEEREQDLRGLDAVLGEEVRVDVVERTLAHRRGRLQLLHRGGADGHSHQPHSARDRARCDQHGRVAGRAEGRHLPADLAQDGLAHIATIVGDERRAKLDHAQGHFRYSGCGTPG
jgi:hypothetical protein